MRRFVQFAAAAAMVSGAAQAQDPREENASAADDSIDEIVVRGRADSLVGLATTASQGTIGIEQLERRPLARPGEVLEAVPGVIVTQHSGAGKANQFFLRGFNLDHGTDFATSVDGVPINLPSHGHGQGWTDLNFLIPELVERVDFRKGVYYADQGDFSSTGAVDLRYFRSLPEAMLQLEGGSFNYARALLASSKRVDDGQLLYAVEYFQNDGPWQNPDDYTKLNGVLRYSAGDDANGWSTTLSAYSGDWQATDQIARRALRQADFDRFDTLNASDGGESQKYMVYGEWHRRSDTSASIVSLYGFYQNLDLFSDFTYFLASPEGDQFEQTDRRRVGGANARHTRFTRLFGRDAEISVGLQLRSDTVDNGLFQTVDRQRTVKADYSGGSVAAITRRDELWQSSVSPYIETRIRWSERVRSVIGARLDYFRFNVDGNLAQNSGTVDDTLLSPKASLIFGPWDSTELYLSAGLGFHSNDARGVTSPDSPADPLVRTVGAELGLRTSRFAGVHSTVSLWWLRVDSELLFVGDAGNTEASRPSRRYGIELANFFSPTDWLTLDADVSLSRARFRDNDPSGRDIPGSLESVVAAGASVHDLGKLSGSLRLRYFGPRPLIEDGSVTSRETILASARLAYQLTDRWQVSADVYNLLDRDDNEIDYFYASRLAGEVAGPDDGGYDDIHFHPVDPISLRVAIKANF